MSDSEENKEETQVTDLIPEDEEIQLIISNEEINIDTDGLRKNKSIELLRDLSHFGLRITVILILNIGIFIYEKLVRERSIGHTILVVFIYDTIVVLETVFHVILSLTCKSKCFNRN